MSAERAVQETVYSALTGNAPYMATVTGVFDGEAPQGTAYPYTVIGATTEVSEGDLNEDGWNLTLTIHDWSAYAGKRECQLIREARDAVLHREALAVTGFGQVVLHREFAEVLTDDDDVTTLRHGVSRYRVRAWPA